MSSKIRVVLHRTAFREQILHNKKLLDDVQEQMETLADDPAVRVYRNEDRDAGNVVATAPAGVEAAHGTLTRMLGSVRV